MSIVTSDKPFLERVKESEQDKFMQASVAKAQDAQWDKREASRHELGNWPQWRDLGEQIRQHVIKYLPLNFQVKCNDDNEFLIVV